MSQLSRRSFSVDRSRLSSTVDDPGVARNEGLSCGVPAIPVTVDVSGASAVSGASGVSEASGVSGEVPDFRTSGFPAERRRKLARRISEDCQAIAGGSCSSSDGFSRALWIMSARKPICSSIFSSRGITISLSKAVTISLTAESVGARLASANGW
jgi:hypothetical protein